MKLGLIALGKFIALAELLLINNGTGRKQQGSIQNKNFSFRMEGLISLVFF